MRLYEYPDSRSTRVRWLLQELDLDFESIRVDLVRGEQLQPEFLAINPYGKVPVLVDGATVLTESAAICTWLAECHPDKALIPAAGSIERARYYQWVSFCLAELEPFLWSIRKHMIIYDKATRSRAAIKLAKTEYRHNVAVLSRHMQNRDYILDGGFSAADIIVGYNLLWGESMKLLSDHTPLTRYLERLTARPLFPHADAGPPG